jgi:hypothetical protein
MKPVVPPKPKGNNPPSVVYKKVESFKKPSGGPVAPRKGVEPTGKKTQVGAFVKKTKPVMPRRGGK